MKIMIFILFFISSTILLIPYAYAESPITPIKEKYVITKNIGWGPWWEDTITTVEINLSDSRNNTSYNLGNNTLVVNVSDFVATSKGKASNALDILPSDKISISSINGSSKTVTEKKIGNETIKIINLSKDLTKFKIDINTNERDTVTYSGKILLKNESMFISIPVDIVIQHDVIELLVAALIGIGSGIGISALLVICIKKITFTNDKPWVSTAVISLVAIPSSVFISTGLIGSVGWDIIVAFSIGIIVITKLLKFKDPPNLDKISFSFDAAKNLPTEKQETLKIILDNIEEFSKMEHEDKDPK